MNTKYCKLIMVAINDGSKKSSAAQSNKYYEMKWDGISSTFNVDFGRVELTQQTATYPISKWSTKYNEKLRKGYKDVTETVAIKVVEKGKENTTILAKIEDSQVEAFLTLMNKYTNGLVNQTYTVKYQNVTQFQVDEAQKIIDKLGKIDIKNVTLFNTELLNLYMIIPRKMSNVKDYLLPNIANTKNLLQQEQDNLDAMATQVKMYSKKKEAPKAKEKKKTEKTLLDLLGIESMKQINGSKEIDYLTKQISGKKLQAIFEVDKSAEKDRFDNWLANQTNKTTKMIYHGTKCASVIPILQQGLKIRPTGNFKFSGKVYGNGNYFSEQFSTSLGYTDGAYRGDAVMLIYEVHIGNVSRSYFHDYNHCKKSGYDSFDGGWLRVAYAEEQAKIKYILWLK